MNNTGFMMDPSGRCGEAFLLPWWRQHGCIDVEMRRDDMVRMGERLWDESVVKFYKRLFWFEFEPMISITSKIRIHVKAF